ncbi:MAG TPA: DUF3168 domain-containing protein [Alphaproteobacteria bacterium]|nr:DUF3168 domain-containing protein [Alphaproteobacteria bacterium]
MAAGMFELQAGIKTVLEANAALMALMGGTARVYDEPLAQPQYPFLLIPEISAFDDSDNTSRGWDATLQVHAYSNLTRGSTEAKLLCDAVLVALDRNESVLQAALMAGAITLCQYISTSDPVMLEGDIGWRQTISFRILMTE